MVRCGRGAGQADLESASGVGTSQAAWFTHIRANLVQLTSIGPGPTLVQRRSPNERLPLPSRDSVTALGESKHAAGVMGGALGYIGLANHLEPGYQIHPAVSDSAMHTGAINPAGPLKGLTRYPVAVDAFIAAPGVSSGQMQQAGGAWAGANTGLVTNDGSTINSFRCSCKLLDLVLLTC